MLLNQPTVWKRGSDPLTEFEWMWKTTIIIMRERWLVLINQMFLSLWPTGDFVRLTETLLPGRWSIKPTRPKRLKVPLTCPTSCSWNTFCRPPDCRVTYDISVSSSFFTSSAFQTENWTQFNQNSFFRLVTALHGCVCVSVCVQVEYKKKYEQTKAHYHMALDTAEQRHHKENAVLHSQVTNGAAASSSPPSAAVNERRSRMSVCAGAGEVQRGLREEQGPLPDGVWRHSDLQSV